MTVISFKQNYNFKSVEDFIPVIGNPIEILSKILMKIFLKYYYKYSVSLILNDKIM